MVLIPASAALASPAPAQASELFVAVDPSSTPELEVIDSTTGSEVGLPIPLADQATGIAEYAQPRTSATQVAVAEDDVFQVVDPSTEGVSTANTLPAAPSAVVVADVSPTEHFAIILLPTLDEVQVENLDNLSAAAETVSLGFSSGTPTAMAIDARDNSFAYVTDKMSHQVDTLQYNTTTPPFDLEGTYTGGSSFDPTAIDVSSPADEALISDGNDLDQSSLSTGVFTAPSTSLNIACSGGVPGAMTIDGTGENVYVQEIGVDDVSDVSLTGESSVCLSTAFSAGPDALVQDGATLAVASATGSSIDLLDTQGSSVGELENTVSLPAAVTAIAPASWQTLDEDAFVAEYSTNEVAMVDLRTNIINQSISVGTEPDAVAVSPDGQYVYVADYGSSAISILETALVDTTAGPLVDTIALPSGADPDALAVSDDGDQLLVADKGTGKLSVIDLNPLDTSTYLTVTSNVCVLSSCSTAADPDAIAVSPGGTRAYVTDGGDAELSIFDQSSGAYTFQVAQTSLFSGEPQGLVFSPNDQWAYVSDSASSGNGHLDMFLVDPSNGEFQTTGSFAPTVGATPGEVALSPQGASAYVVNRGSNTVSVVPTNTSGGTPTATSVSIAGTAEGVAVMPDGTEFVTTSSSTTSPLGIYSTATDASTSSVNLGSTTGSLAIAVSPFYEDAAPTSLAGYENDVNPSVAASNSVDIENGVDTASGGYTFNQDDLSLPDIGLGLDLSQEYDSVSDSVNGPLGYGWSFSYGMTLVQNPWTATTNACQIIVTQENGTPAIFNPPKFFGSSCPSSGYEPPPWEQDTLSTVTSCYSGDSCWDMTRDGSTQFLFDISSTASNGELVFEKNRNGNTVWLTYGSPGKVSYVTGTSGVRELGFTWTGANITAVEDSAGRTATFGYTSGNLTSLTLSASSTDDPTSHEWAFSYNSSHQMTDWWSPNNEAAYSGNTAEATQIAYTSGLVTSVTHPAWLTKCNGTSGTPLCAPETTFTFQSYDTATDTGTVLIHDANANYDVSAAINNGNGDVTLDRYADGVLMDQVNGYGFENSTTAPYDQYPMMATATTSSVPDPFVLLPVASLDADGYLSTTDYDASANPLKAVDPLGRTTSYVYNRFNEVIQKVDPLGNVTSSTYDSDGNELTSTDGVGNVTSYAYNSNGQQCAMLNANGHVAGDALTSCPSGAAPYVTAYGYDAEGDQTSITAYDGPANTVTSTDVTSNLYNSAGEECATLSADGYFAGDRIPTSCPTSGAAFVTVSTAFDVFGNVLSSISPTNASGGTTTTTYDADGNKLTTTDPSLDVTTSTYDPDDQLCWSESLAVTSPSCASPPTGTGTETTTNAYDPDGNEVSSVAPDGNVTTNLACLYETTTGYDNLGQTVSTTTPTGGTTCANETTSTSTDTYDPDGNELESADGSGVTTSSAYDADGEVCWSEVAAVSGPSCASPPASGTDTTSYTYDADGNELTVTDPSGDVTTTTYDKDNRVCWSEPLSVSSPTCGSPPTTETTTDYYDADGNTLAVTGQNGDVATCNPTTTSACADTTYNVYDEQNLELSTTDPLNNTVYTYDSDGTELTAVASSNTGTYTYNGAGQLVQISYTDGTPTVSFQYAANGERCWMFQGSSTNACGSPPSGATTYSYDTSGRLVSETNAAGATDTYGYDASSNLTCVSYPNTASDTCASPGTGLGIVSYAYNQTNQLTSLTDWAGDTLTFTYNGSGQQCWVSTYAPSTPSCSSPPHQTGAITTADTYDAFGNVSDLKTTTGTASTNLLDLSVGTRTPDEFITAETPTVGSTVEATDGYGYNDTDQVDSGPITGSSGSTGYTYTPMGSVTADTTAFSHAGYTAAGALCWTGTGTSSTCTPPSGGTAYSTNPVGQRTGMTPFSGNSASYGWDVESGRLTCANTNGTTCSTSSPTATTTLYTYDGNGLRTSATIGSTTTNYTWGTTNGSSNLLSDGTWDYIYADGGATPIEQIATTGSSPAVDLLLSDESSNVRGLVQLSSGTHQDQLVNYTDYDAYGNPITKSGGAVEAGGLTTAQTGISSNYVGSTPFGFGEGYTDATGFIYLVNRYYDSESAQFLSVDPALSITGKPFEYASDAPTAFVDPSGEKKIPGPGGSGCTPVAETHTGWSWFQFWGWLWLNPCLNSMVIAGVEIGSEIIGALPYWAATVFSLVTTVLAKLMENYGDRCGGGDVDIKVSLIPPIPIPVPFPVCWSGGWIPDHPNMSGRWHAGK
jgi:RHS repeat-associated protein